jgi:hypothetical protein
MTYPRNRHGAYTDAGYQAPPGLVSRGQELRRDIADLDEKRVHYLRWEVFSRLWDANTRHAEAAWRSRADKPLAPHALVFLFTQPAFNVSADAVDSTEIRAATRMWWLGEESRDPERLLIALTDQVDGHDLLTPFDIRREMANRTDPGMREDARYLGLGYSTLDTRTGTFAQVCQHASNEWDIPGSMLYVSTWSENPADQRAFSVNRLRRHRGAPEIHSYNRALSKYMETAMYVFAERRLEELYELAGPILGRLWTLDRALQEADQNRRVLTGHAPATNRGRSS